MNGKIFNQGDNLPFGYYNPALEGRLFWICGYDADEKITSVFTFDKGGEKERNTSYLDSLDKAKYVRDELIDAGWQELVPPEIKFTYPDEKTGEDRELNRKQRRKVMRELDKQRK